MMRVGHPASMNPQDLRVPVVNTSKGHWGIYPQSVVESQNGQYIFITAILERNIDEEHIDSRKLDILVSASELTNPTGRIGILNEIRTWIETTEGDGVLKCRTPKS